MTAILSACTLVYWTQ